MATANEYNNEIGDLRAEIDKLIKEFNDHKDDERFIMRKGQLANKFEAIFGKARGKRNFEDFDRIINLKSRLTSEHWIGTDKTELLGWTRLLILECRKFKNMLEGRKR